ncbi:MAG: RNA polymerase sigma factor [Bacteroidales bacterium]|jgi:RNA polymerase sigma-70 factor (ECF subfamily)|nr:RNA polymerase sigma factor [Bacteroidales bacterium]
MNEYSDDRLLEMFQDESRKYEGFSAIVEHYKVRLYWHIRKIVVAHADADDVLQNTFEKAWKGLSGFRREAQLSTWLYRIATNEAVSFLNQKRQKGFVALDNSETGLLASLQDDAYFSGDQLQLQLQKAILNLPEKQRIVFNMKYFEEMKYEEMSAILKTSVGALKASYHHAVNKIKEYIESVNV